MMYLEPKELLTKRRIEKLAIENGYREDMPEEKWPEIGNYQVFISHSSRDVEFIKKLKFFLRHSKGGIGAYVDWQDPDMQHETNARTAADLKDRIRKARKVIYVVTNDSLKSVWCGWEIGFADCDKGVKDVAILAIKPNNGRWKKHEYLQQYPWIYYDTEEHLFMVAKPSGDRVRLYEWLNDIKEVI